MPASALATVSCWRPSAGSAAASIVPSFTITLPTGAARVPVASMAPPLSILIAAAPSAPLKNAVPPLWTSKVPPIVRLAVL